MSEQPEDRLFNRLPGHHQALDAENGHALRALARLLAAELNVVESDIHQLYDNWFIETCEPWAIPYIGDLVGARPLTPFGEDGAGLRAYIANTLAYRQSKGVAAALEQLARDVTGWPAVGVEFFQRLIQTPHVNHVRPEALGTVSIRDAEAARMTSAPFESGYHTAAAGQPDGLSGRYNIPNFGVFLWRLKSMAYSFVSADDEQPGYIGGVVPRVAPIGPGFRRFDPLGTDRALFNRPAPDLELAARVGRRNVPEPLDRRLLHRDLNGLRDGAPSAGLWFSQAPVVQLRLNGSTVPPNRLHACNLEDRDDGAGGVTWRRPATAGEVYFDPELGRLSLHEDDEALDVEASFAHGAPFDIGGGPYDRRASVDAWREMVFPEGEDPPFRIGVSSRVEDTTDDPALGGPVVTSLADAIDAWNAQRATSSRGVITIFDNASYADDLTAEAALIRLPSQARLAIVAAGWLVEQIEGGGRRRLPDALTPRGRRPHIASSLRIIGEPSAEVDEADGGLLILDGLIVEGGLTVEDGDLSRLELRHATLGAFASGLNSGISVAAGNERLSVLADHAVLGEIVMATASGGVCVLDTVLGEARGEAVEPATAPLVIDAPESDLEIARSTLFGRIAGRSLEAENSILTGVVDIARRQAGCMRYCFAPLPGRTPRRYRCAPDRALSDAKVRLGADWTEAERLKILQRVAPQFVSSAYGSDRFAQLSLACVSEIAQGAEGGAAMGASFHLGEPFRRANLARSFEEYLPFGLAAGALFMT